MSPTRALAERIAATRHHTLTAPAREVGKQALLDFVGVAVAGADEPLARILREQVAEEGGHPQAALIAGGGKATAAQAALVNGAAGHAHDYDDVHTDMTGHPTVPVAPAVLALGELLGRSGAEVLAAFCAGVDAECIVGRYAGPAHYAAGWHATGTLGSFGAAAAAAALYRLDAEATSRALGIAGTQAAGLKAQFGTMCKPLHAGHAAATGTRAAALAARGFESRTDILETRQGFMATQSTSASEQRFAAALDRQSYTEDICFKYHAACYLTHSAMEAIGNLKAGYAGNLAERVAAVEIRVNEGHFDVCNIAEPRTGLEAKFSLRFTAAMALAGADTSGIETFTNDLTTRPELNVLRDKVTVTAHTEPNPDTVVTLTLDNGETLTDSVNVAIPMRDLEAQWVKLERKFRTLTRGPLGEERSEALLRWLKTLDEHEDLGEFFALLC